MRRVKGTYNGSTIVLREPIDLQPNTEVDVLIPEPTEQSLEAILAELDRLPTGEVLSLDEVTALIHEIRESRA